MNRPKLYEERLQWFIDRIGKRVYREDVSCQCDSCKSGTMHGVFVNDKMHAHYLCDISGETDIEYFDEPINKTIETMATLLRESAPIARKDYNCMASDWLTNDYWWRSENLFTFSEFRSIAKAKANNWKVKKGEKYIRNAMVHEVKFYEFIAIPEIHAICTKYDIYEYD